MISQDAEGFLCICAVGTADDDEFEIIATFQVPSFLFMTRRERAKQPLQGPTEHILVAPSDRDLLAKNGDNKKESGIPLSPLTVQGRRWIPRLGLYHILEDNLSLRARMPHSEEITCLALAR